MKIRSITLFVEPTLEPARAGAFFDAARGAFMEQVQTLRLATTPFPSWWHPDRFPALQARESVELWKTTGAEHICLGPVLLRHDAGWLEALPDIVGAVRGVHVAAEIADTAGTIDIGRCRAVAEIIRRISILAGDGSANFYFTALANCPGGTPYFPPAYHVGGSPRFAIAMEAADLVLESVTGAQSLMAARQRLLTAVESVARDLTAAAGQLASTTEIAFGGIDFSAAPAPEKGKSLFEALESLGLGRPGSPGTLFAAAFVAETIGRADFKRCGFSGLMFPVLEDVLLADRAAAGQVTVYDLLSYAAVCGAGLDTVPLPGDVGQETLSSILLDVAALATRLDKPLTARLMPMPGLAAGDPVAIDLPYVGGGRVMAVDDGENRRGLRHATRLEMQAYHRPQD